MIYRKKKVRNDFKKKLPLKNKKNDSQKPKIKTIRIESFHRPKLLTNCQKNIIITTGIQI